MKRKVLIFTVIILSIFMIVACKKSESKSVVSFDFDANPTTGFIWNYEFIGDSDMSDFEVLREEYIPNENKGLVGGGGHMLYSFKAKKSGNKSIKFIYKRPWEGGESAYDIIYKFDIDKDLNIKFLGKEKGDIDTVRELSTFPDPIFE